VGEGVECKWKSIRFHGRREDTRHQRRFAFDGSTPKFSITEDALSGVAANVVLCSGRKNQDFGGAGVKITEVHANVAGSGRRDLDAPDGTAIGRDRFVD
jgi:hypothetical protein